jgi:hypothetical protein
MYIAIHGSELPADCAADETSLTLALELAAHLSERYGGTDDPETIIQRFTDIGMELEVIATDDTRIAPSGLNVVNSCAKGCVKIGTICVCRPAWGPDFSG